MTHETHERIEISDHQGTEVVFHNWLKLSFPSIKKILSSYDINIPFLSRLQTPGNTSPMPIAFGILGDAQR